MSHLREEECDHNVWTYLPDVYISLGPAETAINAAAVSSLLRLSETAFMDSKSQFDAQQSIMVLSLSAGTSSSQSLAYGFAGRMEGHARQEAGQGLEKGTRCHQNCCYLANGQSAQVMRTARSICGLSTHAIASSCDVVACTSFQHLASKCLPDASREQAFASAAKLGEANAASLHSLRDLAFVHRCSAPACSRSLLQDIGRL